MKTLVVYDSNFGNTKQVADVISKTIGGNNKSISVKDFNESDLNNVELLIFGSPITGWRPSEASLNLIDKLDGKLKGICFTTFDTRLKIFVHGDAKEKLAKHLSDFGAKLIFEPQAFYVKGKEGPLYEGELEKAAKWAQLVKDKMKLCQI